MLTLIVWGMEMANQLELNSIYACCQHQGGEFHGRRGQCPIWRSLPNQNWTIIRQNMEGGGDWGVTLTLVNCKFVSSAYAFYSFKKYINMTISMKLDGWWLDIKYKTTRLQLKLQYKTVKGNWPGVFFSLEQDPDPRKKNWILNPGTNYRKL